MSRLKPKTVGLVAGAFAFVFMFLFAAVAGWWLFAPYNPLTVYTATAHSPQTGADGELLYTVKYCRHTSAPSVVNRIVIGVNDTHDNYPLPSVSSPVSAGCGTVTIPVAVGELVNPGTYVIRVDVAFQVNPLRTIDVIFQTNVFRVK